MSLFRSSFIWIVPALACAAGACIVENDSDDDDQGPTSSVGAGGAGGGGQGGMGVGGDLPPACDARVPRPQVPEVIIGPTGLQARVVELMGTAQSELTLMMYQLYCTPCVNALVSAHERGVNVRVMLDGNQNSNNSARTALTNAGVSVQDAPAEFTHAHAKVMVIDNATALVMSANMNDYSFSSERNYGVVNRDPQDVAQLAAIFERDWNGSGAVDTSCTRLIISPENAREGLLELIESATTNLDLAVMYVTDGDMVDAIKAKAMAGVPTRVLLANPEWIDNNPETATELSAAGAQTKYLYSWELHAKLVMADGVPFVGSENLSFNALENNREIGLLVTEPAPAAQIAAQFEADWATGTTAP